VRQWRCLASSRPVVPSGPTASATQGQYDSATLCKKGVTAADLSGPAPSGSLPDGQFRHALVNDVVACGRSPRRALACQFGFGSVGARGMQDPRRRRVRADQTRDGWIGVRGPPLRASPRASSLGAESPMTLGSEPAPAEGCQGRFQRQRTRGRDAAQHAPPHPALLQVPRRAAFFSTDEVTKIHGLAKRDPTVRVPDI
jgi:hypothetical protein